MMSSLFAGIDMDELKDTKELDTAGRDNYELLLHDVLEPRETFVDNAGNTRNGIDVNDIVRFRPIILNDGDVNQTAFNIRVTVAPSAAESNLIIDNLDSAVCGGGTAVGCMGGTELEPRDYLGGGNYHVHTPSGAVLEWTPTVPGEYTISFSVETLMSEHDQDLTNNDITFTVVVEEFTDIQVDLCWTDGPAGDCLADGTLAQGAGVHPFMLTVNTSGSTEWEARELTISVEMTGGVDASMSDFEGAIGASHTLVHGSSTLVDVWHNASNIEATDDHVDNPCPTNDNPCQDQRNVAPYGVVTSYRGAVGADSSGSGGTESFQVTAQLVSFLQYEPSEQETGQAAAGENGTDTAAPDIIWSEVTKYLDDRTGNNDAELSGYFTVFHDVALTSLTGGTNEATEGTLNVGHQIFRAMVIPSGSDLQANHYDWSVTFSIKDENGTELLDIVELSDSNSCVVEQMMGADNYDPEWSYEHAYLGMDPAVAEPEGYACIETQLGPGLYNVKATLSFIDASTTDADPANDCGTGGNDACKSDMNTGNNIRGTQFEVINDNPTLYVSLDRITRGEDAVEVDPPVVVGDSVTLTARGADTETPDEALMYSWTRTSALGGTVPIDCQEGPSSGQCTSTTDVTWIGQRMITATVTDGHGASASDSVLLSVWNHYTVDIPMSGASLSYSMVYAPSVMYEMTAASADQVLGANLGTSGEFNSVVAVDVTVTHLFSPTDVSGESLAVTYDAGDVDDDLDLWFYRAATDEWTALGATKTAANSGGVTLTVDRSSASLPNMESGLYAIFATSNDGTTPPAAGIVPTSLVHDLKPDGQIDLTWELTDSSLANQFMDLVHVYYCADDGSGCDALGGMEDKLAVTEDTHTIMGTDATTYNIIVRVENGNEDASGNALFHPDVGVTTVTADGSVSPSPAVSDLGANAKDLDSSIDGPDALGFTWSATDTGDVETWMICWAAYQFAESDWSGLVSSGTSCAETTDNTMSSDITELTICGGECNGQLYFGVAGVDGTKNVDSAEASYFYDATDPNTAPPTVTEETEETSDSDTPKQAMYAIIALVVLAVIGGAFILTRGGGGDGEEKEWDY
ncbi:MAG: hypothetical protein VX320_04445 [Candidatus Thermoplasmatota archaeon]|nr:hypothetical protein [Candidatus Thermoplasmatota archaeon]